MRPAVSLLSAGRPDASDRNLAKLLDFYGVGYREIALSGKNPVSEAVRPAGNDEYAVLLASGRTFGTMIRTFGETGVNEMMSLEPKYLFLYGLGPDEYSNISVRYLSRGSIRGVASLDADDLAYKVSNACGEMAIGLSGLTFGPIRKDHDCTLDVSGNRFHCNPIISINRHPCFVVFETGRSTVFIAAGRSVADIDAKQQNTFSIKEHFSALIPSLIFIKYVFRHYAWHKEKVYANLVIDDPVLKKKYGFLDYRKLLEAMDESNFTTSIAFIPWNYRRTERKIANMFRERTDRFGLCVHGCDHTNGEFAAGDENVLKYKTVLSGQRMDSHERSTGIQYKKVMTFPQGEYSSSSLKVLKSANYLGAFHSSSRPVDMTDHRYRLRDYLDLCVMCYENFPLFLRRYPGNDVDTKIDVFLGKTLFFVQHHDFFRNGYDRTASFMKKMNRDHERIVWAGLDEILANMYLSRTDYEGNRHCRIYTNDVSIKNGSGHGNRYVVTKEEILNVPIEHVLVNGEKVEYAIEGNGYLRLNLEVEAGNETRVRIVYRGDPGAVHAHAVPNPAKVYLRRMLSEFRDSYLYRNDFLISVANKYRKYLIHRI